MRVDTDDYARPCGSEREIQPEILDEEGAVEKLEETMSEGFLKEYISPLLICDDNTSEATEEIMEDIYDRCQVLVLDNEDLHADEYAIEIVENYMEEDIDLVLAVGSGPIHDISRYIAWKYKIPFVFVPTDESKEEYKNRAAVTLEGKAMFLPPQNPLGVYADPEIMRLVSEQVQKSKNGYSSRGEL